MSEIIKTSRNKSVFVFLIALLILVSCQENNVQSEREITVELLTGNSIKNWVFDATNIDGKEIIPSSCDSTYVLILKSDFTWEEGNLKFNCYQSGSGAWWLNDDNDVLSIRFVNPGNGEYEEKRFEIEELSEEYFAYQIAQNNRLKYVRLRRGGVI